MAEIAILLIVGGLILRNRMSSSSSSTSTSSTSPTWTSGEWGECSKTCGGGIQTRSVSCSSGTDADCSSADQPITEQDCNMEDCPAWFPTDWSDCSKTCGGGVQTRSVVCNKTDEAECLAVMDKPEEIMECNTQTCPTWTIGDWSDCSKTCGSGVKTRSVICSSGNDADCSLYETKPSTSIPCNTQTCPTWTIGDWSDCSKTCGSGIKTRSVICSSGNDADCLAVSTKPDTSMSCNTQDCLNCNLDAYKSQMTTATGQTIKQLISIHQNGENTCSYLATYQPSTNANEYKLLSTNFTFTYSEADKGYVISGQIPTDKDYSKLYGSYDTAKYRVILAVRGASATAKIRFYAVSSSGTATDVSAPDLGTASNNYYSLSTTTKYVLLTIPAASQLVIEITGANAVIEVMDFYQIPLDNSSGSSIISIKSGLKRVMGLSTFNIEYPITFNIKKLMLTNTSITLTGISFYGSTGALQSNTLTYSYGSSQTASPTTSSPITGVSSITITLSNQLTIGKVELYGVGTTMDGGKIYYYDSSGSNILTNTITSSNSGPTSSDRTDDPTGFRKLNIKNGYLNWTNSYYKVNPFSPETFVINDWDKSVNLQRW